MLLSLARDVFEKCLVQSHTKFPRYFQLLTVDPTLAALGLPAYPALSADTHPSKVEEIRRTVYVGNLPKDCNGEEVMQFFNDSIGEVSTYYIVSVLFIK